MTNETEGKRVLLVEDDELQATMVKLYLEGHGFQVEHVSRGDVAASRILESRPDAVVLDGMLPGKDGFDVCRDVRAHYFGPIVLLTARAEDMDQVLGLELGADDYLIKPVEPRVILAHLRACLRRPVIDAVSEPERIEFGSFSISRVDRRVRLAGKEIPFTTAEFDLLWLLAKSAGTILSRDDINRSLRGFDHDGLDRSIDMRVSRLRRRLGDSVDNPARIRTVRNQGYLFSKTDWE